MKRSRWAWGATILWFLFWAGYTYFNWHEFRRLDPNEIGDFFAGLMAPAALFWLVLGYFQQSEELRQNTEALKLQAAALQQQVEETKNMVHVAIERVNLESDEQTFRRRKAVREIQPRFTVRTHELVDDRSVIKIANTEKPARITSATVEGDFRCLIGDYRLSEHEQSLDLVLSGMEDSEECHAGNVFLHYEDALGISQTARFPAIKRASGMFELSPPEQSCNIS